MSHSIPTSQAATAALRPSSSSAFPYYTGCTASGEPPTKGRFCGEIFIDEEGQRWDSTGVDTSDGNGVVYFPPLSSAALYAEVDVLNEAIDALADILNTYHPLDDGLSEDEVRGRRAAGKVIDEVRDRLQRQGDGTFQEALYAAYAGR